VPNKPARIPEAVPAAKAADRMAAVVVSRTAWPPVHPYLPSSADDLTQEALPKAAELTLRGWWFSGPSNLPQKLIARRTASRETHKSLSPNY
jgi:hypothetical protein